MKAALGIAILLPNISLAASTTDTTIKRQLSPEQMMFELHEEATCLVAAQYLKNERVKIHKNNYAALIDEFSVPVDAETSIVKRANMEYTYFAERAKKRYTDVDHHMLLTSAYTHRCLFMNGYEAQRPFIEASEKSTL
ncbi:hypothetical protein L4D09_13325 [Photobacterium makurazakiensis]|uniref:hypothetical protein n=1 Tax=Photobacterium makurazakiensis TaxID=2910234 RepID=UPI003D0F8192